MTDLWPFFDIGNSMNFYSKQRQKLTNVPHFKSRERREEKRREEKRREDNQFEIVEELICFRYFLHDKR